MGDLGEPGVGVAGEESSVASPPSSSNPSTSLIGAEKWALAEETTRKILFQVQPTVASEERRKEVIDYIQRLIKGSLGCQVFPFGSVPLKTYLPDGDIDLTASCGTSSEEVLVNDLISVLEGEDQNEAAEFVVKNVQQIRAEVKLVKCIVQNIVVDISFNQLGGLCTLCFLEQVDRLIGKDHLFKRSIVLIKAWCYYESRILGAHHGLISTYALETLVLYIFHLFHSTLNGPLAVLYKFLDYFSKFDWDNYCISLSGPVRISSLPDIVAEKPENGGCEPLLSNDFLRNCMDAISVPSGRLDMSARTFPQKHLNIIDPLKENNNLGRSISKGNSYRIRSAFAYGARQLGRLLLQPEENIAHDIQKFFSNTLERHGTGERPDVQDMITMAGNNSYHPVLSFSETKSCKEDKVTLYSKYANSVSSTGPCKFNHGKSSLDGGNNVERSGVEIKIERTVSGQLRVSKKEANGSVNGSAVMENRFSGDAEDLVTCRFQGLKISDETTAFHPSEDTPQQCVACHATHLYFSNFVSGNAKLSPRYSHQKEIGQSESTAGKVSSALPHLPDKEMGILATSDEDKNFSIGNHEVLASFKTNNDPLMSNLSDLRGDYESHLRSLQCSRECYESSNTVPAMLVPTLPSQFQSQSSWDALRHNLHFQQNGFCETNANANGFIPRPTFYHTNTLLIPGGTFGIEDVPKSRGTGTYFPNANRPPYLKHLAGKGRTHGNMKSPRNGRTMPPVEASFLERSSLEVSQTLNFGQGNRKPAGPSDLYDPSSPDVQVHPDISGLSLQSEAAPEFGSAGYVPLALNLPEGNWQLNSPPLLAQASSRSPTASQIQISQPVVGMNQDRLTEKSSYRLKNEDDFPPLSI